MHHVLSPPPGVAMSRKVKGWIAVLTIGFAGAMTALPDHGLARYIALVIGIAYGYAVCELTRRAV